MHAASDETRTLRVADSVGWRENFGREARSRDEYSARRRELSASITREEFLPPRDVVEHEQGFRQRRCVRHVAIYRPARRAAVACSSRVPRVGSITTPYRSAAAATPKDLKHINRVAAIRTFRIDYAALTALRKIQLMWWCGSVARETIRCGLRTTAAAETGELDSVGIDSPAQITVPM